MVLSLLVYLTCIVVHFDVTLAAGVHIHVDSDKVINIITEFDRINQFDEFATTLRCQANYDLIAEIVNGITELGKFGLPVKIIKVKSNKNRDDDIATLVTPVR